MADDTDELTSVAVPLEMPQMELLENQWPAAILQSMNMFRQSGIGCDILLMSEEAVALEAHSLVIKAGSPYFKQVDND